MGFLVYWVVQAFLCWLSIRISTKEWLKTNKLDKSDDNMFFWGFVMCLIPIINSLVFFIVICLLIFLKIEKSEYNTAELLANKLFGISKKELSREEE